MKGLKKLAAGFDRLLDVLAYVVGILTGLVMLGVCAEVVMRYFFRSSIPWMIEITQYALVFSLFLGAAWVLRKEGHIAIDVTTNMMSPRTRNLTDDITSVVCALVCLVIMVFGITLSLDYFRTGFTYAATVKVPGYLLQTVVPFGAFLLFVQFSRRAYNLFVKSVAPGQQ